MTKKKRTSKWTSRHDCKAALQVASKMTIRVITGDLVVVSLDETIVFWDLQKQAILGEVNMRR